MVFKGKNRANRCHSCGCLRFVDVYRRGIFQYLNPTSLIWSGTNRGGAVLNCFHGGISGVNNRQKSQCRQMEGPEKQVGQLGGSAGIPPQTIKIPQRILPLRDVQGQDQDDRSKGVARINFQGRSFDGAALRSG